MQFHDAIWLRLAIGALMCVSLQGMGDVVVVVNRTSEPVRFTVSTSSMNSRDVTLPRGEMVTLAMRSRADLDCASATPNDYQLQANEAYYFEPAKAKPSHFAKSTWVAARIARRSRVDQVEKRNGFGRDPRQDSRGRRRERHQRVMGTTPKKTDRRRLGAVERLFHVKFEVVSVETWHSSIEAANFADVMRDFERVVDPKPARLAIGFSSQLSVLMSETTPESIDAPLHSHLLIGEQSTQLTEAERLELLIHRLGHYLARYTARKVVPQCAFGKQTAK